MNTGWVLGLLKKRDEKNNGIEISKEIISGSLFFPSLYFPTY
jgi:hypothetical protein